MILKRPSRLLPFLLLTGLLLMPGSSAAFTIEHPDLLQTWSRLDDPVASGAVSRTWFWGPEAITELVQEPYANAPNGQRWGQYFDKSRMEINEAADPGSIWRITNGLLATELITGRRQIGDTQFENYSPANINVAGDLDDPNGPTYRSFNQLLDRSALPEGTLITQTVNRNGQVGDDQTYAGYGVTASYHVSTTGHTVASVFWDYMNSSGTIEIGGQALNGPLFENPFYGTGYPITEAYWSRIRVGGVEQPVLIQVFERRVLTYTPNNPEGWRVEAGNVGLHYLTWRSNLPNSNSITIPSTNTDDDCNQRSVNMASNGSVKQSNSSTVKQSGGNQTATCTQKNISIQR